MSAGLQGAGAVRVFLCFAFGYLLSFALRSINAVIAPALQSELLLSDADLGLLSSAYFVAFAAMQLPLGIWLDRYGPRRTEAALLLCAAAGALVFASSSTLAGLWLGRALIGIGVSACLMAAFKGYRLWFGAAQQGRLASWMLVAGTAGALSATVPVTLSLPLIGWRGIFMVLALMLVAASAAIFYLLHDTEQRLSPAPSATGVQPDGGYRRIFSHPYFWRLAVLGLFNHSLFTALQTLWAGPWMTTVLGASHSQASQILFAMNLLLMLAYLALGWALPRLVAAGWSMHRIIAIGFAGMVVSQGAMLLTTAPWAWLLWLALALCVPVTSLVQSGAGMAFPAALAGRANSAYNLLLFVGAFVWQWGFGVLADIIKVSGVAPAPAFQMTLGATLILQTCSLVYFVLSRAQPEQDAG